MATMDNMPDLFGEMANLIVQGAGPRDLFSFLESPDTPSGGMQQFLMQQEKEEEVPGQLAPFDEIMATTDGDMALASSLATLGAVEASEKAVIDEIVRTQRIPDDSIRKYLGADPDIIRFEQSDDPNATAAAQVLMSEDDAGRLGSATSLNTENIASYFGTDSSAIQAEIDKMGGYRSKSAVDMFGFNGGFPVPDADGSADPYMTWTPPRFEDIVGLNGEVPFNEGPPGVLNGGPFNGGPPGVPEVQFASGPSGNNNEDVLRLFILHYFEGGKDVDFELDDISKWLQQGEMVLLGKANKDTDRYGEPIAIYYKPREKTIYGLSEWSSQWRAFEGEYSSILGGEGQRNSVSFANSTWEYGPPGGADESFADLTELLGVPAVSVLDTYAERPLDLWQDIRRVQLGPRAGISQWQGTISQGYVQAYGDYLLAGRSDQKFGEYLARREQGEEGPTTPAQQWENALAVSRGMNTPFIGVDIPGGGALYDYFNDKEKGKFNSLAMLVSHLNINPSSVAGAAAYSRLSDLYDIHEARQAIEGKSPGTFLAWINDQMYPSAPVTPSVDVPQISNIPVLPEGGLGIVDPVTSEMVDVGGVPGQEDIYDPGMDPWVGDLWHDALTSEMVGDTGQREAEILNQLSEEDLDAIIGIGSPSYQGQEPNISLGLGNLVPNIREDPFAQPGTPIDLAATFGPNFASMTSAQTGIDPNIFNQLMRAQTINASQPSQAPQSLQIIPTDISPMGPQWRYFLTGDPNKPHEHPTQENISDEEFARLFPMMTPEEMAELAREADLARARAGGWHP